MVKAGYLGLSLILLTLSTCGGCASSMTGNDSRLAETNWVQQQGGQIASHQQARATALCNALCHGWISHKVRVRIINSARLAAWSWPDADIYISRGLAMHLNNGELSAAIAHEMGHLINSGAVQCPYALGHAGEKLNIESGADLTGARVLAAHGISPQNLLAVLNLLRRRTTSASLKTALTQRIYILSSAIASGRVNKRIRNTCRAREARERTVPTGTAITSAASS